MKNYYITVSTGLLEEKHIENMQVTRKLSCIWIYLWLLNKMTKIDESGLGFILGGKPMKLEDIGRDFRYDIKTTRKIVHHLESKKYLILKRTPYGHIFMVTKAKKIFGQAIKRDLPLQGSSKKETYHLHGRSRPTTYTVGLYRQDSIDKGNTEPSSATLLKNKKTMKKNSMGKYREDQPSDSFEEQIDLDTGEPIRGKETKSPIYKQLLMWAENQRGFKFMPNAIGKQYKAFSLAKRSEIQPARLQERWREYSVDKFWQAKGFDWMDVVLSFNKRQ